MIMRQSKRKANKDKGFTMIELVVVLIVLAIMTPIILSRFSTSNAELIAQVDVLKSHLRYAQLMAMNDTASWGITLTNSTTYTLFKTGVSPPPSNLPGDTSYTHTLIKGVTITSGVGTSFRFNEWGNPVDGSGTPLTPVTITLTPSQGSASNIIITKITGFIP